MLIDSVKSRLPDVILCLLILLIALSTIRILITYTNLLGKVDYGPKPWFGDIYCLFREGEEYSKDILIIQISINPAYVDRPLYLLIGTRNETILIYDLKPFHNVTNEYFQRNYIYLEFPAKYLGLGRSMYRETCVSVIFVWKNKTIGITPCIYPEIEEIK